METEKAWAAGFFDGEGCTYVNRTGKYTALRVVVTQFHSPETLLRFQRAVEGLGRMYGPYSKGQYFLRFSKKTGAYAAMQLLWPYLSTIKRAQFTRVHTEVTMRKNPTMPTRIEGKEATIPGIELPLAGGKSSHALEQANEMPEVSMKPNMGDQKDVPTPAFATGKDIREFRKTGGADATPAMPGA